MKQRIINGIGFIILGLLILVLFFVIWQQSTSERGSATLNFVNREKPGSVFSNVANAPILTPTVAPTPIPTPTDIPHIAIRLNPVATDYIEGDNAAFSWSVYGISTTIHSTTVYYGTTSTPGSLAETVAPQTTNYRYDIKDFKEGSYEIPLNFVGNSVLPSNGIFYARAYLYTEGKHVWSDEIVFPVAAKPKYTITVVDYSRSLPKDGNASFTWYIAGPSAMTYYTVIVGSTTSLSGSLGYEKNLTDTPYHLLVSDFQQGSYSVPYQFIGNQRMNESGTYYFRALSVIGDKNVWSDEYSLRVE